MGEADKGQEKGKYANKPYRLYDFRAALGPNPMEEAALVAEKAKAVRRKATPRPCSARRGSCPRQTTRRGVRTESRTAGGMLPPQDCVLCMP